MRERLLFFKLSIVIFTYISYLKSIILLFITRNQTLLICYFWASFVSWAEFLGLLEKSCRVLFYSYLRILNDLIEKEILYKAPFYSAWLLFIFGFNWYIKCYRIFIINSWELKDNLHIIFLFSSTEQELCQENTKSINNAYVNPRIFIKNHARCCRMYFNFQSTETEKRAYQIRSFIKTLEKFAS